MIHLACAPDMDGKTGDYMHLMRFKQPSENARNDRDAKAVFAYGIAQFKIYKDG